MSDFWKEALINTLIILFGVNSLCLFLALPLAWLVEKTDLPFRSLFSKACSLPYLIPSYLLAIAWVTLANPRVGWLNVWFNHLNSSADPTFNIYSIFGIVFVESTVLFSILFFNLKHAFQQVDPALEEAARLSGAGPFKTFFLVTLPLIKNVVFNSVITISLACIASFAVPAILGSPARIFVLTTALFSLLREASLSAQSEALRVAFIFAVSVLGTVFLLRVMRPKQTVLVGAKANKTQLVALNEKKWPCFIGVWTIWILLFAGPLIAVILSSFQSDPGNFHSWSTKAWSYVFSEYPDFYSSLFNSFKVALGSSFVVLLISLIFSLTQWHFHQNKNKSSHILFQTFENISLVLYSLPGTVLAIGLIFFTTKLQLFDLHGSLLIIGLALCLKYLSLGLQTLSPATFMIHPSLIEAARLSGAGTLHRVSKIWLPLLKVPLTTTFILVSVPCLAELTMTILLYGPGTETLGVTLFELQEYSDRSAAAVVAVLLVSVILATQALTSATQRRTVL